MPGLIPRLDVSLLSPRCIPAFSPMYPCFLPDVSLLSPRCIPAFSPMYPCFLPDVSLLSPRCIPAFSPMYHAHDKVPGEGGGGFIPQLVKVTTHTFGPGVEADICLHPNFHNFSDDILLLYKTFHAVYHHLPGGDQHWALPHEVHLSALPRAGQDHHYSL